MKTIMLKLAGPMQSWGTSSRFENRYTDRYPSKSAVVGILAACFGYSRDDSRIERLNDLDFAIRIDQPGELLHDYHIARRFKSNGEITQTYVTNRYYLQDAIFVVALGSNDVNWITEIEYALKYPYFQPYLGRRSNPVNADFFLGTSDTDVISSLEELPWQASDWYKRKKNGKVKLSIYADAHLLPNSPRLMARDRVITFSQRERMHGYRAVGRKDIELMPHTDSSGHDVFSEF